MMLNLLHLNFTLIPLNKEILRSLPWHKNKANNLENFSLALSSCGKPENLAHEYFEPQDNLWLDRAIDSRVDFVVPTLQ